MMNDGTCQVVVLGMVAIIAMYFDRRLHAKGSPNGMELNVGEPPPPMPVQPAPRPTPPPKSKSLKRGKQGSKRSRRR